jgi:hypothetical protein
MLGNVREPRTYIGAVQIIISRHISEKKHLLLITSGIIQEGEVAVETMCVDRSEYNIFFLNYLF